MKILLILILFFNIASAKFYSSTVKQKSFVFKNQKEAQVKLENPIKNSISIIQNETELADSVYTYNYNTNTLTFKSKQNGIFKIYYTQKPVVSPFYYYKKQKIKLANKNTIKKQTPFFLKSTQKLNITGSKTISISVKSDEDATIDQSLYLKIDGEISKEMKIEAQLSDSNSPITPEGDSKHLSNLDKVFIRLYNDNYEFALGDLDLEIKNTKFINYNPHFEGLKASLNLSTVSANAAFAISKGKPSEKDFEGIEGIQGPYYLSSNNQSLLVVSGSETVYLNGQKLSRGDDYTIDYASGSITFTSKNLISSNSRIKVIYQYSSEDFKQNLYLSNNNINITDKLKAGITAIYLQDDKNNPLNEAFTAQDKQSLAQAGDKTAYGIGIFEVDKGQGRYKLANNGDYFVYVGSDSTATHNLIFSYVGENKGDYSQTAYNIFTYEGKNQGSWMPRRKLFQPSSLLNVDSRASFVHKGFNISTEAILSIEDKNLYSNLDDNDNSSGAFAVNFGYKPDFDKIKPEISFEYYERKSKLATFAEHNNTFNSSDLYGVSSYDSLAARQFTLKTSVKTNKFNLSTSFANQNVKDTIKSNLFKTYINVLQGKFYPSFNQQNSFLQTKYQNNTKTKTDLYSSTNTFSYKYKQLELSNYYEFRQMLDEYKNNQNSGTRFNYAKLQTNLDFEHFVNTIYTDYRLDEAKLKTWKKQKKSTETGINSLVSTKNHNLQASYKHRKQTAYVENIESNKSDNANLALAGNFYKKAIRYIGNYSLQNMLYYPKDRKLVWVGNEEGIYDSTGVITDDGEYDYEIVNFGNSIISSEVNLMADVSFSPGLIFTKNSFLNRIETASYMQITEQSNSKNRFKLFLLYPSQLMGENTIYARQNFRQTLWYDLIKKRIIARFDFEKDQKHDKRWVTPETNKLYEYQANLRFKRIFPSDFDLTGIYTTEEDSKYDSSTETYEASAKLYWQINQNINLNSKASYYIEESKQNNSQKKYDMSSIEISEALQWYLDSKYRLDVDISYKNNNKNGDFLNYLGDKKAGSIFKWGLNFEWQINSYSTLTFDYTANSYPKQKTIHNIKMEAKAEF